MATILRHSADSRTTRYTELLRWRSGKLKLMSSTLTSSSRLTPSTTRLTAKEIIMKNMIFMRRYDPNPQARPLWQRETPQNINKCADVPSTRTRQRCTSYSDAYEDKWLSQNWQTYFSRHRLHRLLRHGHKIRHGGILNTGKILNDGESGNQKNGKTKSSGRNGKAKKTDDSCSHKHQETDSGRKLFQLLPKLPRVLKIFFAVLHIHHPSSLF